MKNKCILRSSCAAVLSTAFLLALAATSRADVEYIVNLSIAQGSLVNGPFSLDLQLATGSGNVLNTVTLSGFNVTGGSFTGGTETQIGNVTGSLLQPTPGLTLSDGFPGNVQLDNEDYVQFSAGVTNISFLVDETNHAETPIGGSTPDLFNVAILDSGLNNIATTNANNVLVAGSSADDSVNQAGDSVTGYNSASPDAGGVTTTLTAVPEPGSAGLLLLGVAGLIARRKRTAAPQAA